MDANLRAFLASPTAFRVSSATHFNPPIVQCRACVGQIVFELGTQPDDEEIRITPLHDWREIGARECEGCGDPIR